MFNAMNASKMGRKDLVREFIHLHQEGVIDEKTLEKAIALSLYSEMTTFYDHKVSSKIDRCLDFIKVGRGIKEHRHGSRR